MKKLVVAMMVALLGVAAGMSVFGQVANENRLKVISFEMRETDMDAKVNAPEEDINGKTCAIIKVETTKQGFTFDTGTISITKVVQKQGSIWVYVSPGIRKFDIFHSDYKPCYYELPCVIAPATVYILNLETPDAPKSDQSIVTSSFLKLRTNPKECTVRIGKTTDYEIETKRISEGNYSTRLNVGRYYYKVESQFYETAYGEFDLQKGSGAKDVNLRPAYNLLKINSSPENGATVIVKNTLTGQESTGTTPYTPADKFAKGDYIVTIAHNDYATEEKNITLNGDGTTKEFSYSMSPQYATITCRCSDPTSEIWIDDEYKATGSWTGRLSGSFSHKLESRKEYHTSAIKALTVTNGETRTVTLDAPKPIMAALEVISTPEMATVKVDGKPFGETPIINELIMGIHKVEVSAQGYRPKTFDITIGKGETYALETILEKIAVYVPTPVAGSSEITSSDTNTSSADAKKPQRNPISSETAAATGKVKTFTVNGVSFNMVSVKGGKFTMGATPEQGRLFLSDAKPTHSVTLSSYSIGQTEVTQELWQAVMGGNPSRFKGDKQPVESVSYDDCKKFISKLNRLTGKKFRLPTEAEWEYAARGGKFSKGYKYSGSDNFDDVAWHAYAYNSTHTVATKNANELGIYDMSGNVYEWCSDWYGDYTDSSQKNPKGPSSGVSRVARGGNYGVAERFRYQFDSCYGNLGFRLAL